LSSTHIKPSLGRMEPWINDRVGGRNDEMRSTRNPQMREREVRARGDGPCAPERTCRMRSERRPRYLGIARCCSGERIALTARGLPLVVYNTIARCALSAIKIPRAKCRLFAICGSCRI
jgi:hypothetical protein